MTTHKNMMSKRPVNTHSRMAARHHHGSRAAAGLRQGFGNQLVNRNFNHSASNYNKLPAEMREKIWLPRFQIQLKIWVLNNIDM